MRYLCVLAVISAAAVSSSAATVDLKKPLGESPSAIDSTITIYDLTSRGVDYDLPAAQFSHDLQLHRTPTSDVFPDYLKDESWANGSSYPATVEKQIEIVSSPVPEPTGMIVMLIGAIGMLRKRKPAAA